MDSDLYSWSYLHVGQIRAIQEILGYSVGAHTSDSDSDDDVPDKDADQQRSLCVRLAVIQEEINERHYGSGDDDPRAFAMPAIEQCSVIGGRDAVTARAVAQSKKGMEEGWLDESSRANLAGGRGVDVLFNCAIADLLPTPEEHWKSQHGPTGNAMVAVLNWSKYHIDDESSGIPTSSAPSGDASHACRTLSTRKSKPLGPAELKGRRAAGIDATRTWCTFKSKRFHPKAIREP